MKIINETLRIKTLISWCKLRILLPIKKRQFAGLLNTKIGVDFIATLENCRSSPPEEATDNTMDVATLIKLPSKPSFSPDLHQVAGLKPANVQVNNATMSSLRLRHYALCLPSFSIFLKKARTLSDLWPFSLIWKWQIVVNLYWINQW